MQRIVTIALIFITISISYDYVNAQDDTEVPMIALAKCGYSCWPKYGVDGHEDLNVHLSEMQMKINSLDDYQIGELRGCMEECLVHSSGSEFYPPLDQPRGFSTD